MEGLRVQLRRLGFESEAEIPEEGKQGLSKAQVEDALAELRQKQALL